MGIHLDMDIRSIISGTCIILGTRTSEKYQEGEYCKNLGFHSFNKVFKRQGKALKDLEPCLSKNIYARGTRYRLQRL